MDWVAHQVWNAPATTHDKVLREACRLLDQAEAACGPSPALKRERRVYAKALGGNGFSDEVDSPPLTAWEHYDLGRSYFRSGLLLEAATEFQRGLNLLPQDFWLNFYEGLCAYELGRFENAIAAFRTCIALAPTTAPCYYNRARAEDSLARKQQALADYSRALELDPTLASAALNRGTLLSWLAAHDEAIADYHRVLLAKPDAETLGLTHYNLAIALLAKGDRTSALANVQEALASGYHKAADLDEKIRRGK